MKVQRLLALALVVVASVGVALLSDAFGGLTGISQLEYKTLDWRQTTTMESLQPGAGERESQVAIVFFDEFSITDPELGWAWEQPFPRGHIASVIDAVAAAGASTIGLDVYLELLYPKLNAIDGGDDLLRQAIDRAGNVILVGPVVQTDSGPRLGRPHPFFADVAAGVGAAELPTAFETVREGTLAVRSGIGLQPSFALALYAHAKGFDVDSLLLQTRRWGRIALPGLGATLGEVPESWWEEGTGSNSVVVPFPIRFVGPPSSADAEDAAGAFPAFPSSTVDVTAMLMPDFFRDKIVLIGSGFHDSDKFRTPFFDHDPPPGWAREGDLRPYGYMYGVEIHANALQDMLDERFVRPLGGSGEVLLLLILALIAAGPAFWKGAGAGGVATLAAVGGVVALAFWLWAGEVYGPGGRYFALGPGFVWLPMATPAVAAFLSYVGSVAYVSVVEGKEKRRIKSIFGTYVPADVVNEIADDPDALRRLNEGERRPLSLLFSDLAGFTTMSERMDPKDLLDYLNGYLQDMTRIVFDEKGTLDKYIGDAIMAFWNAPRPQPDHADRALRTAIFMQRKMVELNNRWRAADPEAEDLVVRIGINTGPVIVGNVGGGLRNDYSALGDAVNLAARLEPANKTYDTLVMASQFTLDAADAKAFRFRELDLIAVKGKVEPVKVYEILEMAGVDLPAHREEAIGHYEAGLKAYKGRDWALATTCFRAALEADPDDGPSAVYLERATEYAAEPPPADWDFVVRRTEK
ncbi:MAG: adenylate/guanylate cyclase domain-containing protein [Longimicrobiales bacterium]|nr:adenylate/guanylate cyclase domain-containing protein [Longimicrobiales bacterium]